MARLGTPTIKKLCAIVLLGLLILFAVAVFTRWNTKYAKREGSTEYYVNFGVRVGAIKPLNGNTFWSNFSRASLDDRQADAEACHFSTIRLHDVPWDNEGMRLVDVGQIFANLNADPKNPDNYFFAPTDDYIANIRKGGAVPIYRLGASMENTAARYFAQKPQDFDHYAEICAGIVRHYNKGWANGFEWNLPYWEIWNEPDRNEWWGDEDWNSYCNFYITVAKRLRAEFPNIKIGGPSMSFLQSDKIECLAKLCKKENAPLDFFSWHCYGSPEFLIESPIIARKILDQAGFPDVELHLNEWHYLPGGWEGFLEKSGDGQSMRELSDSPEGLNGVEAAAFIDLVLTRWQDGPLDMSNYYAFGIDLWGMIDSFGKFRPTYYAFLLFGEQISQAPNRVETKDPGKHVSLLGSVDETGKVKRLLVSCFQQDNSAPINITLRGVPAEGEAEVVQINYDSNYETTKVGYSNGILTLKPQRNSVFLVRF